MAVVINELDIKTEAVGLQSSPSGTQQKSGSEAAQQDPVKLVYKSLSMKEQRRHRLETY